MDRITYVAPTAGRLLGIETDGKTSAKVLKYCKDRAERLLLYNPDAIAWWIYEKYNECFKALTATRPLVMRTQSVMPSVTPVCFASMYSGLMPRFHGIRSYVKPVLKCRTLFDAAIDAGLHPVICSTEGDSISKIFLERDMEYYIYPTIAEVNAKAKELIAKNENELIIVYNGNYDACMHKVSPEGEDALCALRENIATYIDLMNVCKTAWHGKRAYSAFLPDHGCHEIDGGLGSHGLDMDEDMYVVHLWNVV